MALKDLFRRNDLPSETRERMQKLERIIDEKTAAHDGLLTQLLGILEQIDKQTMVLGVHETGESPDDSRPRTIVRDVHPNADIDDIHNIQTAKPINQSVKSRAASWLDELKAEKAEVIAYRAEIAAIREPVSSAFWKAKNYLNEHRGQRFQFAKFKTLKTETIENLRASRLERLDEIELIENAQLPADFAKSRMIAQVEKLAEQGVPNCGRLLEVEGAEIRWPSQYIITDRHIPVPNGNALVAALFKKQLISMLSEDIDAMASPDALHPDEKAVRLSKLQADCLNLEQREVALLFQSDNLLSIRADTDPRACLGIVAPDDKNGEV